MADFWGDVASQRVARAMSLGNDEEAVVDQGKTSSTLHTNFEKEELESHRAVYVGVHVPLGRQSRRRHRHRGHRHHRKRRERLDREDGRESPTYDTPSQRVQFILGTEDDDEEHIPHDLFTELDELAFRDGHVQEWKETARWLKFEEDVEDGGERWSKPYVATLSLHSLFELRSCILNGTVLLDMRANTIEEIADMVIDSMVASGQLEDSVRDRVKEAMLRRHHHQNEKKLSNRIPLVRSFADIGKKHSDSTLLDRNGEGLFSSHLSLLRPSSVASCDSSTPLPSPRTSVLFGRFLSAPTSPPQTTPTLHRRRLLSEPCRPVPSPNVIGYLGNDTTPSGQASSSGVPRRSSAPEGLLEIPTVVVVPPEEEEEFQMEDFQEQELPQSLSGLLASPQSAPGNLDNNKNGESRMNGGSRENSTVDFSKVNGRERPGEKPGTWRKTWIRTGGKTWFFTLRVL